MDVNCQLTLILHVGSPAANLPGFVANARKVLRMPADYSNEGTHPGKVLAVTLRNLHHSKSEIARFLGISRQTLYEILGSRQSITAAVAIRVSRLTGTRAEMCLNHQIALLLDDLHFA